MSLFADDPSTDMQEGSFSAHKEGGRESSLWVMKIEYLCHGNFFAEETRRAVPLKPQLLQVERVLRQVRGQPTYSLHSPQNFLLRSVLTMTRPV